MEVDPLLFGCEYMTQGKRTLTESVTRLFENAEFTGGDYMYERRTLCIIIQEQLYPLKSLAKVKDIGQVFLNIVCGMCVPFHFSIIIHLPPSSSSLAP